MARTRAGGIGWAVATVLFGILFFFAALFAIIFSRQATQAEIDAQQATQRLQDVIKENERNRQDYIAITSDQPADAGDQSDVGKLLDRISFLNTKLLGKSQAERQEIESELDRLGIPATSSFVGEVERLQAELREAQRQTEQVREEEAAALQEAEEAKARVTQLVESHQNTVAELQRELSSKVDEVAQLESDFKSAVSQLEAKLQEDQSESSTVRAELETTITELESEITRLRREMDDMREKFEQKQALFPPESPDGQIVSILAEEGLVYVNLAKDDHVVPGMTFEVFAEDDLIKIDPYNPDQFDPEGKATIEILRVTDSSSLARVVRQSRGATLLEGDQVFNIIYSPDTTYRFFVHGVFDIRRTGEATASDRRRIESMVKKWGGELTEDLTYMTDFLVLGVEPPLPDPLPPDPTPLETEQYLEAKNRYDEYQSYVARALDLGIPVLNQNRFLKLTGFYQR